MNRLTLLSLQILVGVISIALWQILTTVPIGGVILLPPFFFSTPGDVAARVFKWFVDGSIWRHLWITLVEALSDLFNVVIVDTGRVGMASTLPMFIGSDATVVLVSGETTNPIFLAAVRDDIAGLGFEVGPIVRLAPDRADVA